MVDVLKVPPEATSQSSESASVEVEESVIAWPRQAVSALRLKRACGMGDTAITMLSWTSQPLASVAVTVSVVLVAGLKV